MAKPKVEADKRLYDTLKEIWDIFNAGADDYLNEVGSTTDWLRGYLSCYYKDEPTRCPESLDYFLGKFDGWAKEEEIDIEDEDVKSLGNRDYPDESLSFMINRRR